MDDVMNGGPQNQNIIPSEMQGMKSIVSQILLSQDCCCIPLAPPPPAPSGSRDNFRDIQVKVHIRKPDRDSWMYLGKGLVTQEVTGHSSRVGSSASIFGAPVGL